MFNSSGIRLLKVLTKRALFLLVVIFVVALYTDPEAIKSQLATIMNRVSVDSSANEANDTSTRNAFDADGSHIAFTSLASNLVPGDSNIAADIFVYETETGAVERVSVTSGGAQGNGESDSPAISNDARYVAFQSAANNLVSGDTNNRVDIFVYDRTLDTIERVSVDDGGTQGNDHSKFPSISGDGQYVVFQSEATNLVAGDTNGSSDIFRYDRNADTIERISVDTSGTQGNSDSIYGVVSDDGHYVAYSSTSSNLIAWDANGLSDVFLRDTVLSTTERLSNPPVCASPTPTSLTPSPTEPPEETDHISTQPSISEHGRYVAFESLATNLICEDTNDARDIFVVDRYLNTIERVSVASDGTESNGSNGSTVDNPNEIISANGQYVVFKSFASNLVSSDTNGVVDVFIHDRQSGITSLASVNSLGEQANDVSYYPSISAEGRYVGFYSFATNLVPDDVSGFGDVFVFDRDVLVPTLTPTPTTVPTSGPTPTQTPENPANIYFDQNLTSPNEVTVNTIGGLVTVQCHETLQAGHVFIQVQDAPPVQVNQDFNIVRTNFDIYPNEDLVCSKLTVCLPYNYQELLDQNLYEPDLRLWHHWQFHWNDVTSFTDPIDQVELLNAVSENDNASFSTIYGQICGVVQDFSPFVIGTLSGETLAEIATPTPTPVPGTETPVPTQPEAELTPKLPDAGTEASTLWFAMLILAAMGSGVVLYRKGF